MMEFGQIAGLVLMGTFIVLFAWLAWKGTELKDPTEDENPEDIQCPVCGYYCIGKGGHGCINKPNFQRKKYGEN